MEIVFLLTHFVMATCAVTVVVMVLPPPNFALNKWKVDLSQISLKRAFGRFRFSTFSFFRLASSLLAIFIR